jgi:hypothetical protein
VGCGLFVAGLVAGNLLAEAAGTGEAHPAAPAAEAADPGPRSVVDDVPVGYARSPAGATAAATSYLTTLSERLVTLAPPARDAAMARMLAPGAPSDLGTQLGRATASIDNARRAAAGGSGASRAFIRNLPVAYRLRAFSPDRASVGVWSDAVWVIDGIATPGQAWATTTLELVWADGDWRLWSLASVDGPTPAAPSALASTPTQLLDGLRDYVGYRYVANG